MSKQSTPKNSRRNFIRNAAIASGGIILASNFISCSKDDDISLETKKINSNFKNNNFKREGLNIK